MKSSRSFESYNDFIRSGDLDRFTKLLARYELFKKIINLPGDIVEGGVLKGTGLLFWARLLEIFSPNSHRKVIGFDTFSGYPEDSSIKADQRISKEYNAEQVQKASEISEETLYQVAKDLGLERRIELVKGHVQQTIPEYVSAHPGFRISLLNLDFVLFDATKVTLDNLMPLVVRNGIVIFDEYAYPHSTESNAVDLFLRDQPIELEAIPWAKSPSAYFKKI